MDQKFKLLIQYSVQVNFLPGFRNTNIAAQNAIRLPDIIRYDNVELITGSDEFIIIFSAAFRAYAFFVFIWFLFLNANFSIRKIGVRYGAHMIKGLNHRVIQV